MAIPITVNGNDDNALAQVITDGVVVSVYSGNTESAIRRAADAAGATLTYSGNDLNLLQLLAAYITVALYELLVIGGAVTVNGLVATFDGSGPGYVGAGQGTGKKALVVESAAALASGKLLYASIFDSYALPPGAKVDIRVDDLGNWRAYGTTSDAVIRAGLILAPGDRFAIWRDSATGAWGVIYPDNTDSGDLSATYGGFTGEGFALVISSNAGAVEVMTEGHALTLPADYVEFTPPEAA